MAGCPRDFDRGQKPRNLAAEKEHPGNKKDLPEPSDEVRDAVEEKNGGKGKKAGGLPPILDTERQ